MHAAAAQCNRARCQSNPLTPPPEALRARHRRRLFLPLRLSNSVCRRQCILGEMHGARLRSRCSQHAENRRIRACLDILERPAAAEEAGWPRSHNTGK